jgi:putative restriction endonuclease
MSEKLIDNEKSFWLGKLANLNVARTAKRGLAPHKPLMLLTVMDLIESGDVVDGWVKYDVRLVSRFRDYWELVRARQANAPDIPMPFHALGGDRDQIWQRFTVDGQPSQARDTTRLCALDPTFYQCLQDEEFRHQARALLVSLYFTPNEQVMLCARLRLPLPKTEAIAELRQHADAFKDSQKKGRDSRFKSDVISGYYHTCALTGYRLETEDSSLVQACHIHQHAVSGNDDPRNGLALTPDAHWMFDQGLWTAMHKGDHFLIKVAIGRFSESSPWAKSLANCEGSPLYFHESARIRPAQEHLHWHQRQKFLGSQR